MEGKIQKQEVPTGDYSDFGTSTKTVFKKVPNTINFAKGGDAPISERSGSTISVKRAPTKKRLNSSICMYMPATVGVNTKADYQEQDIGGIAKLLSEFGTTFTQGGSFEAAFNSVKGTLKESLQQVTKDPINQIAPGLKALAEIQAGKVFSNRMETVFRGLSKRSFQYQFTMIVNQKQKHNQLEKL